MQINAEAKTVTIELEQLALIQRQLNKLQRVAQGIKQEQDSNSILTDLDIQMDALSSIRDALSLPKGPVKVDR